MNRILSFIIAVLISLAVTSCLIDNDMSYPRIKADITAFEVSGQKSVNINAETRSIDIVLEEDADISKQRITVLTFSEGARCDELAVDEYISLAEPLKVIVSTYQDYEWTISATQPIDRHVKVKGQIGKAEFNVQTRYALVKISDNQDLGKVVFEDMKLEPKGAELLGYVQKNGGEKSIVPVTFPLTLDCVIPREFVYKNGENECTWTVDVDVMSVAMSVTSVNAWCYSVDVNAVFDGNGTPYLEFKKASGDEAWSKFEELEVSGFDIKAKISDLEADTDYLVRVVNGEKTSDNVPFKTGKPEQIDNLNFDSWYSTKSGNKDIWYPNLNETFKVWGTANPASGSFIGSLTTPDGVFTAVSGEGKNAARLESKYAVIAFAAGNIFTGEFVKLNGLNAILKWGHKFTARPSALTGYYSYSPKVIDKVKSPYENLKGTKDRCSIAVFLTDWTEPREIDTSKGDSEGGFIKQSKDNPDIIAYGKLETDEDSGSEYKEFRIDLEYWRPDATPTYIVIVASSSYKGDYFTGGVGSTLYVDELELEYK